MTQGLFQAERGLYFAPIRHHSPACAWALQAMLQELRPAQVLIEMPADLSAHLAALQDPRTRPPVAILAQAPTQDQDGAASRRVGHYPFSAHSPEWIALRQGRGIAFIDLPFASRETGPDRETLSEAPFGRGDFVAGLCRKLGCRDGFELWDHLFEQRLGEADWRSFFTDCGTYCAGLRAASPPEPSDLAREAHMSRAIARALEAEGPIVVVTGGYHTQALLDPRPGPLPDAGQAVSGLIRYGHAAMDALAGYAAGLPQPFYYDEAWAAAEAQGGPPDWTALNARLLEGFDRSLPLPARVETLRMAAALGQLRGHGGGLRHDLIDALGSACDKDDSRALALRFALHLRGTAMGEVPPGLARLPLVEEARSRARALRFDISDSLERRRSLDIRRKPRHRAASEFAHAMALLETGFARRASGPSLAAPLGRDILFEDWTYAWTPAVESRLAELLHLGDRVEEVCLACLTAARAQLVAEGHGRDLGRLVDLVLRGLRAGLAGQLGPFIGLVQGDLAGAGFSALAQALQRLCAERAEPLAPLVRGLADRLVYLCDDLVRTTPPEIPERLAGLAILAELLTQGGIDPAPFDAALDRVIAADPPPQIRGAVLGAVVLSRRGQHEADLIGADLIGALRGQFAGSRLHEADRLGVLQGLLVAAPQLLWLRPAVLQAIDHCIAGLEEAAFLQLLPHLRLALTGLSPRETERLADDIAALHGRAGTSLMRLDPAAMAADAALAGILAQDGLGGWLDD